MKLIVAGSRSYGERESRQLVRRAIELSGWIDRISEVVHGACPTGIDAAADFMCGRRWPIRRFPADWSLGKKAGPLRNAAMAEYGEALVVVWTGNPETSPGSASMLREATKRGLPIVELIVTGASFEVRRSGEWGPRGEKE